MKSHTNSIKCPECGKSQLATVIHTFPYFSYVHNCERCNYTIMESEWELNPENKMKLKIKIFFIKIMLRLFAIWDVLFSEKFELKTWDKKGRQKNHTKFWKSEIENL